MIIKCRQNTFETNSSSMHSLVVSKNPKEQNPYYMLNKDGKLYDYDEMYFGRYPFKLLYSTKDKIWYAFANYYYDEMKLQELSELVAEIVPNCTGIDFDYFKQNDEMVGVDELLLDHWLCELGITLKEFLTNPKYIVVCDGDEYCIWSDMKENGLINTNNIEKELGHYYED